MAKKFATVPAECHSDDRVIECIFDAVVWLKKATYKDIKALHDCGWAGDYPADQVAIDMAGKDDDIAFMFKYIEKKNQGGKRDHIGFECHVQKTEALQWLDKNRNRIYTRLINEEEV